MEKLIEVLKPENLRYLIVALGAVMLERSLSTIDPSEAIRLMSTAGGPQKFAQWWGVAVDAYTMTMLWPVLFALLNSIHKEVRVTLEFFYLIVFAHAVSLLVMAFWFYWYTQGGIAEEMVEHQLEWIVDSTINIVMIGLFCCALSIFWFRKGWTVFSHPQSAADESKFAKQD